MIPKVIHYCWFGGNELPKLAKKCIKSWEKYCPDYEIKRWDESNFDISICPLYVRQAYENKKWAFVTDYVRLKILHENGGIYFDTDVEVIKNIDEFLKYDAFFCFESEKYVATGLGFGCVEKNEVVYEMMMQYAEISFVKKDGTFDILACPARNTEVFIDRGLKQNGELQFLDENVAIFPSEYFCPINGETMVKKITDNTYTIHWFSGSWLPLKEKIKLKVYAVLGKIVGEENIYKIKKKVKKLFKK